MRYSNKVEVKSKYSTFEDDQTEKKKNRKMRTSQIGLPRVLQLPQFLATF